ncbi:MAG TPA: hypothetical protein VFZ37_20100 [Jiangellaceae bacterium]
MAQDFAEVDLGVAGADDAYAPPPEPVPAWHRRGVVAGLFVFGLVIGVLGWQARVDNAVDIELVASGMAVQNQTDADNPALRHFGLNVYNAGKHDLSLLGLELPGWEPGAPDERDQMLQSGTWTTVGVATVPTCDVPVPDEIIATVRRDTADVAIALELPPGQADLGVYGDACAGAAPPLTVTALQDRQWLNARTEQSLVTEISVAGSIADNMVVAVSGAASGVTGQASSVPAPMLLGARVDVVWEIIDCAAAEDLREVEFEVTVESVAGERTESVVLAEPYLTYVLANYAAREC